MAEHKKDDWKSHLWALVVPVVMVGGLILLYFSLYLPNLIDRWLRRHS
jgi:hypothetical protein